MTLNEWSFSEGAGVKVVRGVLANLANL